MKKSITVFSLFVIISFLSASVQAQTYTYRLSTSFNANEAGAPALTQIPNDQGFTGNFTTRPVPVSTCEQGGDAKGYFFEDDAGLQFDNPDGFITTTYSLSLIFQFDEFIAPPPWVRILSFTHDDDHGIYIYLTNPPTNGTLDFWPHGTVGNDNFFNTVDFYQLILIRDNAGLVHVYINGNEFAEYDDSGTQEYIPQPGKNYLKFFRDHPSVLADEASPGFVSNIVISKIAWTPQEVAVKWGEFCESLLSTEELNIETIRIFPIPAKNNLTVQLPGIQSRATLSVFDITGKLIIQQDVFKESTSIDVSRLHSGLYILKIDQGTASRMIKFTKN